jgi:hypothetical protein
MQDMPQSADDEQNAVLDPLWSNCDRGFVILFDDNEPNRFRRFGSTATGYAKKETLAEN